MREHVGTKVIVTDNIQRYHRFFTYRFTYIKVTSDLFIVFVVKYFSIHMI